PFVAQGVELTIGVHAAQCASEFSDDVFLALEDDASRTIRAGDEALAGFESSGTKLRSRDGDLVLGTDGRGTPTSYLYIPHRSKGNAASYVSQRRSRAREAQPARPVNVDPLLNDRPEPSCVGTTGGTIGVTGGPRLA